VTDAVEAATGSLAYADSKFFCYGNNGTLNLVTLNNNQLKVTGTLKITQGTGQHFSHPVIADGSMYIRHGNALMAYQLK